MIVLNWVITDRLSIEFGGNWHYKIFGRIVFWSKLILLSGTTAPQYFLDSCLELGCDGQTVD